MMVAAKSIVQKVKLGASVAEFDNDLDKYFIETETFRSVINDDGDIISGDKGTGKTAIYRILKRNYRTYRKLEAVEVVDAFNPQGDPVFQRLLSGPNLNEEQYRTFWKAYIFSLVGNWLLDIYPDNYNEELSKLCDTLSYLELDATDVSPETIFGKLHGLVDRLMRPSAVEAEMSISELGMPIVKPRVELDSDHEGQKIIYNGDYLATLEKALQSVDVQVWVLFDRLDEAFSGTPKVEVPALRALLRTYLDLTNLTSVRIKLFLRKDLFRKIIKGGFVNLTHINARRIDIVWDDEDLWSMVLERILLDKELRSFFGEEVTKDKFLQILFPEQIDTGDRKPSTEKWIISRIRDGNNNRPPRNIIDLLNKAKDAQLRREQRDERDIEPEIGPIIESDAVKRAFKQLSEQRVQDTLLAEADDLIPTIESFRDGKSEHNDETLKVVIGDDENFTSIVQSLVDVGFLEEFGSNYKIPMLYRDGLKIKQGKAFSITRETEDDGVSA
ncbi:P-loop ATPase, Sll1717 family [Pseudovibrio denitrificans]|uniref:P-loop ATPase, Sll1717 family n=1 Tax=Pseudovibrio denitrificans TaxID=258256 RepID=UPI0039BF025C